MQRNLANPVTIIEHIGRCMPDVQAAMPLSAPEWRIPFPLRTSANPGTRPPLEAIGLRAFLLDPLVRSGGRPCGAGPTAQVGPEK